MNKLLKDQMQPWEFPKWRKEERIGEVVIGNPINTVVGGNNPGRNEGAAMQRWIAIKAALQSGGLTSTNFWRSCLANQREIY